MHCYSITFPRAQNSFYIHSFYKIDWNARLYVSVVSDLIRYEDMEHVMRVLTKSEQRNENSNNRIRRKQIE